MTTTLNASTAGAGGFIATSDNSGSLALQTAGTTAVTINTSQQVGIGTTSPTSPLQVNTAGVNTTVQINSTDANGGYGANLSFNNTGTGGRQYVIYSTSNGDGEVGGGKLKFTDATAGTTRMLIDSSGNLLVRTTTSTNFQDGISLYSASQNSQLLVGHGNGASSGNYYAAFYYNTNTIGTITQNGTTAVAYNTSSDYRLKENIAPLTGALNKVSQLKPVSYTWKASPEETGEGFIAHELAEVCPQAVHGTKDEVDADGNPKYQGVDTSFLVATLTAAIQELKAINDTQAETLTQQTEAINALTARIVALEEK